MFHRAIITIGFSAFLGLTCAQDRRTGTIQYAPEGTGYRVNVDIPPPRTIPGARKAHDDYLIEFGDGTHRFEQAPLHQFPPGTHTIRTSIINNYDDGKPPKIPPRIIEIDDSRADAGPSPGASIPPDDPLMFLVFQDPLPEEEVVCIITYSNTGSVHVSGKIDLYFNEYLYDRAHFDFIEARLHHGETELPDELLTEYADYDYDNTVASVQYMDVVSDQGNAIDRSALDNTFSQRKGWEFSDLAPGETRNMYVTLQCTPAMVRDTQATVRLAATVESDDGRIRMMKIEHKQIVTSHDPNRISVSPRRLRFARTVRRPIEYYVKFRNDGDGPARKILVQCHLPDQIDLQSLQILEMYPPCPVCPEEEVSYGCLDTTRTDEGVLFTFKNVYLPGRGQGLTGKDSTKGFIRFALMPGQKLRKVPLGARAEIIFDQNEPIRTNTAKTRVSADLRPGLIGGVTTRSPESANLSNIGYFAGTIIAPNMPYRIYYQAEIMPVYTGYSVTDQATGILLADYRQWRLDLVPLQIRKNITSFAGVGTGVHVSTLVYEQETVNGVATDRWFDSVTMSVFGDLNIGWVRSGMSGGVRYYLAPWDREQNFWSIYLAIRR